MDTIGGAVNKHLEYLNKQKDEAVRRGDKEEVAYYEKEIAELEDLLAALERDIKTVKAEQEAKKK